MAEALGIAASVIQIVDGAVKLRSLWQSIRDGPEDLSDSVQDIERTARSLKRSQELFAKTDGIDHEIVTECSIDLERALNALRAVLASLEIAVRRNRKVGALKIELKKDELSRGRRKLERAQKLLGSAQQNLCLAIQLSHRELTEQSYAILVNIAGLLPQENGSGVVVLPAITSSPAAAENDSHEDRGRRPSGNNVQVRSRHPRQSDSSFYLRFTVWKRCYELACHRETASLQLLFRTYNIIDYESPPYIAVRTGDIDALQALFSAGDASPFDQDEDGSSLLLLALEYEKPAVARFLLNQGGCTGLSPVSKRDSKLLPHLEPDDLDMWGFVTDFRKRVCNIAEIVHLLTEQFDVDLAQWAGEPVARGEEEWTNCWKSNGLAQVSQAATLGLHILPREVRAGLANASWTSTIPNLAEFQQLLGTDLSVQDILELSLAPQSDVPDILSGIFHTYDLDDWSSIVREVFIFDKLQESSSCWLVPTLAKIPFDHNRILNAERANDKSQLWLRFLKNSGVDLEHYGIRESQAIAKRNKANWRSGYVGLVYGPEPEHWKLYFACSNIEYELAGEFWNLVENPELYSVPGSFLVDNEEDISWWTRCWLLEPIRRQAEKAERRKIWEETQRANSIVEVA